MNSDLNAARQRTAALREAHKAGDDLIRSLKQTAFRAERYAAKLEALPGEDGQEAAAYRELAEELRELAEAPA